MTKYEKITVKTNKSRKDVVELANSIFAAIADMHYSTKNGIATVEFYAFTRSPQKDRERVNSEIATAGEKMTYLDCTADFDAEKILNTATAETETERAYIAYLKADYKKPTKRAAAETRAAAAETRAAAAEAEIERLRAELATLKKAGEKK